MAYNKRQKLQDNIAAIRTVFQLEKEGSTATDAERELLKRYIGFGGLKCVLNPVDKDMSQNEKVWKTSDRAFRGDTAVWLVKNASYTWSTKTAFRIRKDGHTPTVRLEQTPFAFMNCYVRTARMTDSIESMLRA